MKDMNDSCHKKVELSYGLRLIADHVADNSRVLDLGCGDGSLLHFLKEHKNVKGWGVDISYENVLCCIKRGISVFQGDIEEGLDDFQNDLYDYVIISQTMQEIRSIERLMLEALRIGNQVIVSFPNFAFFANRIYLLFRGLSPVTANLPHAWYRSPNVHFFSINDFRYFCSDKNIQILNEVSYCEGARFCQYLAQVVPNVFAQHNMLVLKDKVK